MEEEDMQDRTASPLTLNPDNNNNKHFNLLQVPAAAVVSSNNGTRTNHHREVRATARSKWPSCSRNRWVVVVGEEEGEEEEEGVDGDE